VRSGTSIGANYREANETDTKKDFRYKCGLCRKESKETVYWLHVTREVNEEFEEDILPLLEEAEEFVKIFASIVNKSS